MTDDAPKKSRLVSMRLPTPLLDALDTYAAEADTSRTGLVAHLLTERLVAEGRIEEFAEK